MKELLDSVKIIKPQKIGIMIKDNHLIVIGYNSKIFKDTHILKVNKLNNHKDDYYLEFYLKDLLEVTKNKAFNYELKDNFIYLTVDGKTVKVESLGSISRERSKLMDIYSTDIDKFHSINITNTNIDYIFKNFSMKGKEVLSANEFGVFFTKINNSYYFMSNNNKIIQLLRRNNKTYYSQGENSINVNNYKIPHVLRRIISINEENTLYITETDKSVVYVDDYDTYIVAPKSEFKFINFTRNENKYISIFKNLLKSDRQITLEITGKEDLLEFISSLKEDLYIYIKNNHVKSKKSMNTNYFNADDIFKIVKSIDIEKDLELMFPIKADMINSILENNTIRYITLDLNSSFVIFSDYYDLSKTYNLYVFKTSNYC